jgi:hypothetical protein
MLRTEGPVIGRGRMRDGRLRIEQANRLAAELQQLRNGVVEITIARQRVTRSEAANAFYWASLVDRLAHRTLYTPRQIHELFKVRFLPLRLAVPNRCGEVQAEVVIGGTTRGLSPVRFADYCQAIEAWLTDDLGLTDGPDSVDQAGVL